MALVIGFALGTSGGVMQTILHNPLASPYTLGVGTAAGFGASIAIVLGLGSVATSVSAFVFAMLICMMIYILGRNSGSSNALVLSGIADDRTEQKRSLRWIREQSLDKNCVASLANHDPAVRPHTIVL